MVLPRGLNHNAILSSRSSAPQKLEENDDGSRRRHGIGACGYCARMGHVHNHAYLLEKDKPCKNFLATSLEYPRAFCARPYSRRFVRHWKDTTPRAIREDFARPSRSGSRLISIGDNSTKIGKHWKTRVRRSAQEACRQTTHRHSKAE